MLVVGAFHVDALFDYEKFYSACTPTGLCVLYLVIMIQYLNIASLRFTFTYYNRKFGVILKCYPAFRIANMPQLSSDYKQALGFALVYVNHFFTG